MRSHVVTHREAFRVLWQKKTTKADREAVQMKLKAKERYDLHSHSLPNLPIGASMQIQHSVQKLWQNVGEIIEKRHGGCSFLVRLNWKTFKEYTGVTSVLLKLCSPSP